MNGREIIDKLATPGKYLVFVDETGTSGKPLPDLASDFQLMCGVGVSSSHYSELKASLADRLNKLGPNFHEFHATEIVNPKKGSPWKTLSLNVRQDTLRFLSKSLLEVPSDLFYCYVSGEQYADLLARAKQFADVDFDQKQGLRHVFFESLLSLCRTREPREPVAIVADSEKRLDGVIKIQTVTDFPDIYQGGIIHASSHDEPGLQLADFAAYLLNRLFHSTNRIKEERHGPFDEIVLSAYSDLRARLRDLLSAS
jgi:hypothetical protein